MFEDAPVERHIIANGDYTWLILNAPDVLPRNIPSLDTYPTDFTRFRDLLSPMWPSPANIFVAMTPRNSRACDLTACLGRRGDVVDLVCDKYGMWFLEPSLYAKWCHLENNLTTVINTLRNARHIFWGLDDVRIKKPWQCGYGRKHKTKESAALAASISREAFTFLQSHLALIIAGYKSRDEWWKAVMLCEGAYENFANLLAASPMANFSRSDKRVGIYIDMSNRDTLDWFRKYWSGLGRGFAPLYLRYENKHLPLKTLDKLGLPEANLSLEEVNDARRRLQFRLDYRINDMGRNTLVNPSYNTYNPEHNPAADIVLNEARVRLVEPTTEIMDIYCPNNGPVPGETSFLAPKEPSYRTLDVSKFPAPRHLSDQRPGENMWHYYERRRSTLEAYMSCETEAKREQRLSREETFRNCPAPGSGTHAPKVFVWELWFESDDVQGFYELVPISRQNAVDSFCKIDHNSQRRYDSVRNLWHLWEGFSPNERSPTPSESGFPMAPGSPAPDVLSYDDPSWANNQPWHDHAQPDQTADFAATAADADAAVDDGTVVDPEDDERDQCFFDAEDAFKWYFGFSIPDPCPTPPDLDDGGIRRLQRDFCASVSDTAEVMSSTNRTLWRHVAAFRDGLDNDNNIYWIANPNHPKHLTITPGDNRLATHIWDHDLERKSFVIEISFPHLANSEFKLLVYDPAAVILLRRVAESLPQCVQRLATCGFQFNMVVPYPRRSVQSWSGSFVSEGSLGYVEPSAGEYGDKMQMAGSQALYRAYVAQREGFLRSPRGRAALSAGGIIWRLAVESLDPGIVLADGGADAAEWEGRTASWMARYTRSFRFGTDEYCDYQLTESDEAIICGVYKVLTDQPNDSVSDMSWWPKPNVWRKSGLNVGYWSELAEEAYLKTRSALQRGECVLRTTRNWKRSITFSHRAPKNAGKVRERMALFL